MKTIVKEVSFPCPVLLLFVGKFLTEPPKVIRKTFLTVLCIEDFVSYSVFNKKGLLEHKEE